MAIKQADMMILISSSIHGATTVRRTSDIAKAFAVATAAPKPVAITVWRIIDESTRCAYPFNFICDSKDDVFRTFGMITSGKGVGYDSNSANLRERR